MKNKKESDSLKATNDIKAEQSCVETAPDTDILKDTYKGRNCPKSKVEKARLGIPMTMEIIGDPAAEMPLLVDGARYGRQFEVDCGEIYTLRLGVHSDPDGIGAIPVDTVAMLMIPTSPSTEVQVTAMFALQEIFPAMFGDSVILHSDKPIRLEYLYGSAQLEGNNSVNPNTLSLGNECVSQNGDNIIISHIHLEDLVPKHCTYNYDTNFMPHASRLILYAKFECWCFLHIRNIVFLNIGLYCNSLVRLCV